MLIVNFESHNFKAVLKFRDCSIAFDVCFHLIWYSDKKINYKKAVMKWFQEQDV